MANLLDEMNPVIRQEGRDIHVIAKQIPVENDSVAMAIVYGGVFAGVLLVVLGIVLAIQKVIFMLMLSIVGVVLIYYTLSQIKHTEAYFSQLEQKINANASTVDNYIEERVIVLREAAAIVKQAIQLDADTFVTLAKYRSGNFNAETRFEAERALRAADRTFDVVFENYPNLRAHEALQKAMQHNLYLQREITAARELYNNSVYLWNADIFKFPIKKHVAAKKGLTTRIPFIAPSEIKDQARTVFFE